jgi:K+-sensing histidine kinase KdpD
VLTNLLDNAFNCRLNGEPIDVVVTRPTEAEAKVSVRNRGPGIPPGKRRQIMGWG